MAGKKFSEFSTSAMGAATSFLVGYDTVADTNDRWDRSAIAGWLTPALSIDTLYANNATIATTRIAKVTDTLTFQNLAGTSTLFSLNNDGTFTLGEGATSQGDTAVSIGKDAEAKAVGTIALGHNTMVDTDAGGGTDGIAIGNSSQGRTSGIAIGATAYCYATNISIGNNAGDYNTSNAGIVTIGNKLRPIGANSINLAARNSSAANIVPNVDNTFNVYLADASVVGAEDFQIVRDGTSTLRTNLTVTGQACAGNKLTGITDLTFDWDDGNIQKTTMGASTPTFTASNPKLGATYILLLTQTGAVTATWTGVKWPAATAPTLSGNLKTDVITLVCYDVTGAGLYYATSVLNYTT